jgi:hypothetical protein
MPAQQPQRHPELRDASRNLSFTSTYEAPAASIVSLTDIAGTYVSPDRSMTLVVAPPGGVRHGLLDVLPVHRGAQADAQPQLAAALSLTFQGGACALGTSTVTGIAAYDASQRQLVGVALDGTGATASLFQAAKP